MDPKAKQQQDGIDVAAKTGDQSKESAWCRHKITATDATDALINSRHKA